MDKPHGNTGNKNAIKPESERLNTVITLRCKKAEREIWNEQALELGMTLGEFVRFKCNGGQKDG